MKKILFLILAIAFISMPVFAEETIIAHGKNPQGKSFFPYTGLVSKKDSGWQNSGIDNGVFEIAVSNGNLDVRYIDASKRIKSALEEGGKVMILNKGNNEVSVFVVYPAETIEVYTFYIDKDGKKKFIFTQVKSGENALITSSSIFTGSCDFIYFDKFPE